jgi:hypothetical protein
MIISIKQFAIYFKNEHIKLWPHIHTNTDVLNSRRRIALFTTAIFC